MSLENLLGDFYSREEVRSYFPMLWSILEDLLWNSL